MFLVTIWLYLLFICWNHVLYRNYVAMTWMTLYGQMEPKEARDYTIQQKIMETRGWIT